MEINFILIKIKEKYDSISFELIILFKWERVYETLIRESASSIPYRKHFFFLDLEAEYLRSGFHCVIEVRRQSLSLLSTHHPRLCLSFVSDLFVFLFCVKSKIMLVFDVAFSAVVTSSIKDRS